MKYFAIGLHTIGIVILVWTLAFFLKPKSVPIPPVQAGRAAPVSTPEVLKKDADTAAQALSSLTLLKDQLGRLPLVQVATTPLLGLTPVRDLSASALRIMPKRQLTLVLQSRLEPRAMIDGKLVKPGDTLSDDGRVAEINTDRVVLVERYGTQTLTMATGRARMAAPVPVDAK